MTKKELVMTWSLGLSLVLERGGQKNGALPSLQVELCRELGVCCMMNSLAGAEKRCLLPAGIWAQPHGSRFSGFPEGVLGGLKQWLLSLSLMQL